MSTPDRRALLERAHPELSVRRQCTLLSLARSGVYRPIPVEDETDLGLMRRIDERRHRGTRSTPTCCGA